MCILIQDGDTALHDAANGGYTETVNQLVSVGADINIINNVSQYVCCIYVWFKYNN